MTLALVDCESFYASCERIFRPNLKNKPIVVLSNNDGCVIAFSKEAKKMGISMGVPWFRVRKSFLKQKGQVFSSNFAFYGDMSARVMNILEGFVPKIEIYSIDEAFLDFDTLKQNYDLYDFSCHIRSLVKQWTGIPVRIGIAPNKTLSKIAINEIKRRNIKPTKLLPLWDLMGVTLGFGTAMLGEKAAMLCTASVEEVIDGHYKDQTYKLGKDEEELKKKIMKFRQDELDHKDIAYDNGATKKGLYGVLDKIIKTSSRIAITISEKV